MNYEEMSDKELGVKVTIAIIKLKQTGIKSIEHNVNQGCIWIETIGFHSYPIIDINNPADAWPIIVENEISLHWNWVEKDKCTAIGVKCETASLGKRYSNVECTLDNPLRAAMIVFLKMQACK